MYHEVVFYMICQDFSFKTFYVDSETAWFPAGCCLLLSDLPQLRSRAAQTQEAGRLHTDRERAGPPHIGHGDPRWSSTHCPHRLTPLHTGLHVSLYTVNTSCRAGEINRQEQDPPHCTASLWTCACSTSVSILVIMGVASEQSQEWAWVR